METLRFRRMIGKTMATGVPGGVPANLVTAGPGGGGGGGGGGGNGGSGGGGGGDSEVDSLLLSTCWSQNNSSTGGGGGGNLSNDYLIDSQKLILDQSITSLGSEMDSTQDSEIATKATMDALDNLLLNSQPINTNLAELKPLPPFTGYTANLSINGIQGHHYHAIAQRIPEENNNTYNNAYSSEHNIVSSSTCISADSVNLVNPAADSSVKTLYAVDECADSVSGVKLEYSDCMTVNPADSCVVADSCVSHVKHEMSEYVDISSIEDIAAIIGSAIADTTVPNNNQLEADDPTGSRDSWMDLDAWIGDACVDNSSQKNIIISQESLPEFILPHSPQQSNTAATTTEYCQSKSSSSSLASNQPGSSALQSLLTHGYMPLLQNRLQNGPPVKQEASSSTSFGGVDLISTSSPPANVVSTTDSVLINGRYIQQTHYGVLGGGNSLTDDRIRSPDLLGQNYPHTTTTTTSIPKKSRNRTQKKAQQQAAAAQAQQHAQQQHQQASSSTVFTTEQSLGLLGKEKPVHRCHICNRGFLNKSNIKVHLRTHTGEKPFRCETCAKAFRQKAHLIKHQQIHKRIGRD